jgi:hypothetical protein
LPLLGKSQPSGQPWDEDVENEVERRASHGEFGC